MKGTGFASTWMLSPWARLRSLRCLRRIDVCARPSAGRASARGESASSLSSRVGAAAFSTRRPRRSRGTPSTPSRRQKDSWKTPPPKRTSRARTRYCAQAVSNALGSAAALVRRIQILRARRRRPPARKTTDRPANPGRDQTPTLRRLAGAPSASSGPTASGSRTSTRSSRPGATPARRTATARPGRRANYQATRSASPRAARLKPPGARPATPGPTLVLSRRAPATRRASRSLW